MRFLLTILLINILSRTNTSTLAEDGEDGAEAPELSINDDKLPPLDGLEGLEVRSDDQTIDGIFKQVMGSDAEKPMASAIMVSW